jgi:hypothetical protein
MWCAATSTARAAHVPPLHVIRFVVGAGFTWPGSAPGAAQDPRPFPCPFPCPNGSVG